MSTNKSNGQVAYEAYGEHTGWKSLANGKAIPQWVDMKPEIQEAWEKSAAVLVASQGKVDSQLAEFRAGMAIEIEGQLLPEGASAAMCEGRSLAVELRQRFGKANELSELLIRECGTNDVAVLASRSQELNKLEKFLSESKGLPGFEGTPVKVATQIIGQYVPELHAQQEILARVVNALGLKEVDGVLEVIAALKKRAQDSEAPFVELKGLTYRRTGSLIELRTAETGEAHAAVMRQVTDMLEACGIKQH